jgi:colanic acid biosynthesis glycosyl transferase WcaI
LLTGTGAQRLDLEAEARKRNLQNVIFRPPQSRSELARSLAVPDLHLVTLRRGCEDYVFPSKLYGAVAVGRPVLFLGATTSEIASLVREHQIGFAVSSDNIAGAVEAIRHLQQSRDLASRFAHNAASFTRAFHATVAMTQWNALLNQLSQQVSPAGANKAVAIP